MSETLQRQRRYLETMGIDVWVQRSALSPAETPAADEPSVPGPVEAGMPVERMGWPQLTDAVATCTLCALNETRTQTVFGVGNAEADCLIVGEAPGGEEDRRGEPFVGRAGQLLNAMLAGIGLERERVYITNILKCRPPGNRDPQVQEMACCEPYLLRQIALLRPKVILACGRISAQSLLRTTQPIGRLRGTVHRYADTGVALVATYHPAYLLRSPEHKGKSWSDLKLLRGLLGG